MFKIEIIANPLSGKVERVTASLEVKLKRKWLSLLTIFKTLIFLKLPLTFTKVPIYSILQSLQT